MNNNNTYGKKTAILNVCWLMMIFQSMSLFQYEYYIGLLVDDDVQRHVIHLRKIIIV